MTNDLTKDQIRVVLAQIDTHVGAVAANTKKIIAWSEQAYREKHADLVVFPELTLVGYPPEDLLWRPGLKIAVDDALLSLQQANL
ncbi:MAG: NAD+ synthase, partial [Enterobacterales bacterium]|nr:NAD+ synthase [Enterobacterales bacterium]